MYGYGYDGCGMGYAAPAVGGCGFGYAAPVVGGCGWGHGTFVLIVVLFILLIIIGASYC
ncbi:YjcZ family sporulation protein [Neobacillus vireti]|uniref:YjcZ family sporulation protein n=1 Tax=Neobacillus vireti TaxID=220686 RepID=UPI002FFD6741